MAALVIKHLPPDIHMRLKEEAQRNRRSMTQEAVVILERALRPLPGLKRQKPIVPKRPFTHQWLMRAMRQGRA